MRLLAMAVLGALIMGCGPKPIKVRHQEGVYHVVRPGETLWRICKTYGVDMDYVAKVNGIRDPSRIRVDQRIFIPGAKEVKRVKVPRRTPEGEKGASPDFSWPVRGKVSRGFSSDPKDRHDGIDIAAPLGTPIKAAAPGKVAFSGELKGYGKVVILEHKGGYYTIYAHNLVNLVEEDQWVEGGQIIAKVGKSGNAKGAHLHFEIRRGAKPLDPMRYLGTTTSY